jgi:hypothetical protein
MKYLALLILSTCAIGWTATTGKWSGDLFGGYCLMGAKGAVTDPAIVTISSIDNYEKSGGLCAQGDLIYKNKIRISADWLPTKFVGSDSPIKSTVYLQNYDLGGSLNFGPPEKWSFYFGGNVRLLNFKVDNFLSNGTAIPSVGIDKKFLLPMLLVGGNIHLSKRFSLNAVGKFFYWNENSLYDVTGALAFKVYKAITLMGGYRYSHFKYAKDGLDADLKISGPYLLLGVQF